MSSAPAAAAPPTPSPTVRKRRRPSLLRSWLTETAWLAAGSYLVAWPLLGRLTAAPLVLAGVLAGLQAWHRWGELGLRRDPLPPERAELRGWLVKLGELAGVPVTEVAVIPSPSAEFIVSEELVRRGVIVLCDEDLDRLATWGLLAQACHQLSLAQIPPVWLPRGLFMAGLGLGVAHALRPHSGLAAMAVFGVVMIVTAWRGVDRAERRAPEATTAGNALLGLMRQTHPDAFAELAKEQGLT